MGLPGRSTWFFTWIFCPPQIALRQQEWEQFRHLAARKSGSELGGGAVEDDPAQNCINLYRHPQKYQKVSKKFLDRMKIVEIHLHLSLRLPESMAQRKSLKSVSRDVCG